MFEYRDGENPEGRLVIKMKVNLMQDGINTSFTDYERIIDPDGTGHSEVTGETPKLFGETTPTSHAHKYLARFEYIYEPEPYQHEEIYIEWNLPNTLDSVGEYTFTVMDVNGSPSYGYVNITESDITN